MNAAIGLMVKIKMPEVKACDVNILVALPCYGGLTYVSSNRSIRIMIEIFRQYGIRHQIIELTSESLIPRGRNAFANVVAFDKDPNGEHYTHLLFLDVDIGFNGANILDAIGQDKDIVALPYPCKDINWNYIYDAASKGVSDPQVLSRMGSRPIINTNGTVESFNTAEPVQFPQLGTGILLIKRHVLLKFAEDPERRYKLMEGEKKFYPNRDYAYDYFRIGIDKTTRFYNSEDFQFCLDAREMGFQTILLPWAVTTHTGPYEFVMDIQAQGQYGIPKLEGAPKGGFSPVTI
jgi:hypothetical protein